MTRKHDIVKIGEDNNELLCPLCGAELVALVTEYYTDVPIRFDVGQLRFRTDRGAGRFDDKRIGDLYCINKGCRWWGDSETIEILHPSGDIV